MNDADQSAFDHEGGPEEGAEPFLPENRARNLHAGEVLEDHRLALDRDAPRDPSPHRDPDTAGDFLFQAIRRPHRQLRFILGEEQDHHGVRREGLPDPTDQLAKQVVEPQMGEGRVGDALEVAKPLGRRLDLRACGLLARDKRLGASLGRVQGSAEPADHQRLEHEDAQPNHRAQPALGER